MKKKFLYLVFIISIIFSSFNVFASTKTYERTNDNLLVENWVNVNGHNIDNIMSTPAVNAEEKVYDYAELFTDSEESKLVTKINKYINDTGLDLAIVTIDVNNKHSARVYAEDFYDYNTFGKSSKRSGLLFLIDMDTREIYLTGVGKAKRIYNDEIYDLILDNTYNYVSIGDYYGCVSYLINSLSSYADSGIGYRSKYILGIVIFAIISTTIIMVIMVTMNKMVYKASSSREYLKEDTKRVNKIREIFLGSHTSKVRIDNDSSFGSGGGGSSTHISSSGTSHHGGGRHF